MKRIKWRVQEFIEPLDSLLSAEITGPDELVLQKEEQKLPKPFTIEVLKHDTDYKKIDELSYRFAYGSQTIHISRDDVLSFFSQLSVVIDTISDKGVEKKERVTNLLLKMVQFQEPIHSFSNALILVQTSSADAIGMEELDSIMNFIVGNLAKSASVKYGIGTRDYLNQRIRLLIALNKPINVPEIFKSREK
ncbi:hypothetical protein [Prevotella lacticifex]|uniref:hypothetical protein n=1 Tax=Prevotella lacticifex TaxID=2854755 RepID=UPI001CC5E340|nr:hypothetical protein [Prevotella lacticifex]